uniref:Uncharacterized protein n=1 Tax=Odontella aurita TaxID=265563 RepID=A0A7S4J2C3_9STRA|mmetsp:Transcript_36085/g.107953  ORF Transcript_36085/g.107953 Transcript_36085/m.107953 type:complete len:332 (+) Transcript_36085:830-1825(+)|eukprot:CAMPEP_0113544922 /NCGR_PEP_ID=MMETSP0015_2-20120614/10974_1 /TAXON_ID=2838 /ORGANISM="Odontella" /LENGTH=331 /DNA_ID=CAMNT_0000445229 /DNA_START=479 /DNA_END=1474 /DNA_ORIENTATION=+ /assembly_acc=CAM_ASM_000160
MLVEGPLHHEDHHHAASGLPDYLRTVMAPEDDASSPSRRRPRLWMDNPTAPSPGHDYDSDSEDEDHDDEDQDCYFDEDDRDEHDDRCRHRGKRRRQSPPSYLARPAAGGLTRGLTLRAALLPARARRTLVTFSSPLISDVRTRPRTSPEDVRGLFYSRVDERRFREEARRERRMRARGEWDSEDEEMEGGEDDEAIVEGACKTEAGGDMTAESASARGAAATTADEDPNEVTESSSSDEDEEGESDDSDEEDTITEATSKTELEGIVAEIAEEDAHKFSMREGRGGDDPKENKHDNHLGHLDRAGEDIEENDRAGEDIKENDFQVSDGESA